MNGTFAVEICAGDLESALAAGRGGADRVELCDNLRWGDHPERRDDRRGLPPAGDPRPRPDPAAGRRFPGDRGRAGRDAARYRDRHGSWARPAWSWGCSSRMATIDRQRTARLAELARPLSVTFHKAFDQTPDPDEALDTLIALGVDRVLSSGGRPTAVEGIPTLAHGRAGPRPHRHHGRRAASADALEMRPRAGTGRPRGPPRLGRDPARGKRDASGTGRRSGAALERRPSGEGPGDRRSRQRSWNQNYWNAELIESPRFQIQWYFS